jgi:hypothetical protein
LFTLKDTRPQPPEPEQTPHEERYSILSEDPAVLGRADDPLLRAGEWAELFRRDFEYEAFFDWFDKRNDDMRPDRLSLLGEIPLHWAPEQVPPPLRKYFRDLMNKEP